MGGAVSTLKKRKGLDGFLDQIQSPPAEPEVPELREPTEHDKLVDVGRRWLIARSHVVITEVSGCSEEPDVFGLDSNIKCVRKGVELRTYGTTLLECKASRSDFKADSKKFFRMYPDQGIGRNRYYLTPPGLISVDELPENWGLLETTGKRVKIIRMATAFKEYNTMAEHSLMISTFRRLRIPEGTHTSIRAYTYDTKCKATLSIMDCD